jgi:hypothetical protein
MNAAKPATLQINCQDISANVGFPAARIELSLNDQPAQHGVLYCRQPQIIATALKTAVEQAQLRTKHSNKHPAAGQEVQLAVPLWAMLKRTEESHYNVLSAIEDLRMKHHDDISLYVAKVSFIKTERRVIDSWVSNDPTNVRRSEEQELLYKLERSMRLHDEFVELLVSAAKQMTADAWPEYLCNALAMLGQVEADELVAQSLN